MALSPQGMVERASAELSKCINGLGLRGKAKEKAKRDDVVGVNGNAGDRGWPKGGQQQLENGNAVAVAPAGSSSGGGGGGQQGSPRPALKVKATDKPTRFLARRTSTGHNGVYSSAGASSAASVGTTGAVATPGAIRKSERTTALLLTLKRPLTCPDLWQDERFLSKFFLYFSMTDRAALAQVCVRWRDVVYQPRFWTGHTALVQWRRLSTTEPERTRELRRRFFASLQRRGFDALCLQGASDSDVVDLLALFPPAAASRVRSVSLRYCPLSDKGLETLLDHLQGVSSLELSGCNEVTEVGLWASLSPRIMVLSLSDCINVADEAVGAVAQLLPHLAEFNLQAYHVTDGGLGYLGSRPNPTLSTLRLRSCWEITNQGILNIVHALPNLIVLSLSGCSKLTDDAVELLAESLPRLRVLDLSWCPRITDAALEYIACDLSQLEELTLDRCVHITDIGVGYISTMLSLSALFLRWCTQLRDLALQHLCSMRNLCVLSLAGCPLLTSSGLSSLIQLRHLQELELTNCPGTSPELFDYLREHLPHCLVVE